MTRKTIRQTIEDSLNNHCLDKESIERSGGFACFYKTTYDSLLDELEVKMLRKYEEALKRGMELKE